MSVHQTDQLWGAETTKAFENFPISGERVPASVIHWLGRIKAASARVNAELGLLDSQMAERIATAADRVAEGSYDDQFPLDVFQTGSGTSSNMPRWTPPPTTCFLRSTSSSEPSAPRPRSSRTLSRLAVLT